MANNARTNETSFLDEKTGPKLHVKDVLFTILRNAHWLLLCGVIGAVVAGYWVRHQNRVYESYARVLIKGSSTGNNDGSIREASIKNMFATRSLYNSSINNEMMILTSKSAMLEVAKALNLNVRYTTKTKLVNRVKDLYGESPVTVAFVDNNEEDVMDFNVTVVDDSLVTIELDNYVPISARFGDTVATPFGRVVPEKTWYCTPSYYNVPIHVSHNSLSATADYYRAAMQVFRDDEMNTIVNLSLRDASPIRAAEVINEAIKVYNEDAVKDKQRIIAYTYDYINERLKLLHSDLGIQENALANFKRQNSLLDLSSYGQTYLATSIQSSEEIERLNKQLSTARYLMQVNESSDEPKIIPSNVGIDDEHISKLISNYNDIVLELGSFQNQNNPTVRQRKAELERLKRDMNTLLGVYIGVLQERIAGVRSTADMAASKMRSVPEQQLYIENIERLQKIKEELYLHLLSRREELMISQPSIEPNGKVLDPARVNRSPIAPNESRTTMMGLLIGLLVPVAVFFLRRLFDTKVKFYSDVIHVTSAPFLCEIPARAKDDERDLVVIDNDNDAMSESFRLLRAKVDFLGTDAGESRSRCYMITSILPGMGKTFISSNLAASLGIAGKRVVLLDLDLRRGSLTRRFYSRHYAGLSNYLVGKTNNIDDIICHK